MTIPNLPTDNLYKFIALTGVLFFLFANVYPKYKHQEISGDLITIDGDILKLDIEKQKISDKKEELRKQIMDLDHRCNCGSKSIINDSVIIRSKIIDGPQNLIDLSKSIDTLISQWQELKLQFVSKQIDIITKEKILNKKLQDIIDYQNEADTFIPISVFIIFLGFISWYNKTQKIQDNILKEQFKEFITNEHCQSCGIYLKNQDFYFSLEKSEQKKIKYCDKCYQGGAFTEVDLNYQQMKERVKKRCKELGFSKLQTYFYLLRLKNLHRWENNFKW